MALSPSSPADTPPFALARDMLAGRRPMDDKRAAGHLIMSPDFERVALSPGWRATQRLSALADLALLVAAAPLPPKEQQIAIAELSRLALRILWWQGLLGPGMAPEARPDVAAVTLVEFAAAGLLPEGPAGWMVLDRAKELLMREDVVKALLADEPRRIRLAEQLALAEARVHALAL